MADAMRCGVPLTGAGRWDRGAGMGLAGALRDRLGGETRPCPRVRGRLKVAETYAARRREVKGGAGMPEANRAAVGADVADSR